MPNVKHATLQRETRERQSKRCNITGREKIKEKIPGSIYLPRKHFPTKTEISTETAETDRQTRGQFKAHKRITVLKKRNTMFISRPGRLLFTGCKVIEGGSGGEVGGRKGTLHASEVKRCKQASDEKNE